MNIVFKKLTEEYIEQIRLWRNSDHVKKYMFNKDYISKENQKKWYESIKKDKNKIYFLVFSGNNPIGIINFVNISPTKKTSEWGFYIGNQDYLAKGIGSQIMNLGIKYAFNLLHINELSAQVLTKNVISINLHKKFKFKIINKNNNIVSMRLNKEEYFDKDIFQDIKPPFIIAEMSGNHNQSLDRALKIVEEAAKAGADAIKLQTYKADTITLKADNKYFRINDKNSLWNGRNLYELYEEAHTPWDWQEKIFQKAKELGIIAFSSPFDETAVDFLESINCPIYKIASFEIVHLPLIKKVAKTKKPMIFSTGMASLEEIELAYKTAKENGADDITILKCTSAYPADASDANLVTIADLQKRFPDCKVGLSDHTHGIGVSVASVSYGATVIEKHFTLDRSDGGVDSEFSLEPEELKSLVIESKKAYKAKGKISYQKSKKEENSLMFRPSIWASRDIKSGEKFSKDNIIIRRPGYGLEPKYYEEIIGRKIKQDIKLGEPLSKNLIEEN